MWNLNDLYKSIEDNNLSIDKKNVILLADELCKKYKNRIKSLTSNSLLSAIKKYEQIEMILNKINSYAYLMHTANTSDPNVSKFYQSISEFKVDVLNNILWFSIELNSIDDRKLKNVIKDKKFIKYRYYLRHILKIKQHVLDENREIIINKMSQTGKDSFIKFYDKFTSSITYDGLTFSEITSIFSTNPDRDKRKKAGITIAKKIKENLTIYTFILNTLLLDKKINDEIRNYNFAEEETLLNYDIDKKTIDTMSKVISNNYNISQKYYSTKSNILNTKLYEWDRYNDIFMSNKSNISWNEARDIILDSFKSFSGIFYKTAKEFFDNHWIDYDTRKSKRGGAYCSYVSKSTHPYVFMNYTGTINDVNTLAHELGHAIHGVLSNKQSELEYRPSTATAEIASVFAESLVFDELYSKTIDKKEKINLLGSKLQNTFATVFRQNAFYLFEKKIHKIRRTLGELSSEDICSIYQESLSPMFGNSLKLTDNHKYMWANISHFYHYNFYVFTYAFGELLATSLYAQYKSEGIKFIDRYIKALQIGGSESPIEITKAMGININSESFWQNGLDLINNEVEEFERLSLT